MSIFAPIIKVVNSLFPQKAALKEEHTESWYFTPEGKNAYDSLSTASEKTYFFLRYLCLIQNKENNEDTVDALYQIAFVMSSSMVDSNLEFGGYPNILDPQKNPFVYFVKHDVLRPQYAYADKDKFALKLLGLLHCGPNNTYQSDMPYGLITFCEENEPLSDLYKIERDIITICGFSIPFERDKIPPAYSYALDYVVKDDSGMNYEEDPDETDQDL